MSFVLDSYAARSCPLKTVNAFTPGLRPPVERRPDPPFFHDPDAIEREVFDAVLAGGATVLDLRPLRQCSADEAERGCLEAMASGVDVLLGARLPRDTEHHRAGRPSLLVRAAGDELGYHPVLLKFQKVLESASPDASPLVASSLAAPRRPFELPERGFRWSSRANTALQLAHHWRLLEECGYAAQHPWAGVIGLDRPNTSPPGVPATTEPIIAWIDLAAPTVAPDPATVPVPQDADPISSLARYDHEHARRVELALAASTPGWTPPEPAITAECRGCVWLDHCTARLDPQDLSLQIDKTPLDAHEVATLRGLGVRLVGDLASADLEGLLADYLPRASHRGGAEQRLRRAHHRAELLDRGVLLERQTTGPLDLPTHRLEIDIDIETSADDRVYLWGFLVDDPDADALEVRQFAAFADLDDAGERDLAAEAMAWLRERVTGRDAAVYHYSDYEVIRLNRLAPHLGDVGPWARDWAAEHFVDLFSVMRENFFGAHGLGLKVVASSVTPFAWRDEDPGGLNSQAWFAQAVEDADPQVRHDAAVRVLEYNEDDVRATWHLRRWLREQA